MPPKRKLENDDEHNSDKDEETSSDEVGKEDQEDEVDDDELELSDFLASEQHCIEMLKRHRPNKQALDVSAAPQASNAENETSTQRRSGRTPQPPIPQNLGPHVSGRLSETGAFLDVNDKQALAESEARELSRLAYLIGAVTSGGCTAVLKTGETLVVSQNATNATNTNAEHASGMLNAVGSTRMDAKRGAEDVEPDASKKATVTENVQNYRTTELSRTDKSEVKNQADGDAKRRVEKSSTYLKKSDIKHIIVHEGTVEGKHCEMRLLDALHAFIACGGSLQGVPIVLGIEKLCCALCYQGVELFRILHGANVVVQGTHGNLYGDTAGWALPRFVEENLEQFAGLMAMLASNKAGEYKAHFDKDKTTWSPKLREAVETAIKGATGKQGTKKKQKKASETDKQSTTGYVSDGEDDRPLQSKADLFKSTKPQKAESKLAPIRARLSAVTTRAEFWRAIQAAIKQSAATRDWSAALRLLASLSPPEVRQYYRDLMEDKQLGLGYENSLDEKELDELLAILHDLLGAALDDNKSQLSFDKRPKGGGGDGGNSGESRMIETC